jgi:hypothetical protein
MSNYPFSTASLNLNEEIWSSGNYTPFNACAGIVDNYTPINKNAMINSIGYEISSIQNFVNNEFLGRSNLPVNSGFFKQVMIGSGEPYENNSFYSLTIGKEYNDEGGDVFIKTHGGVGLEITGDNGDYEHITSLGEHLVISCDGADNKGEIEIIAGDNYGYDGNITLSASGVIIDAQKFTVKSNDYEILTISGDGTGDAIFTNELLGFKFYNYGGSGIYLTGDNGYYDRINGLGNTLFITCDGQNDINYNGKVVIEAGDGIGGDGSVEIEASGFAIVTQKFGVFGYTTSGIANWVAGTDAAAINEIKQILVNFGFMNAAP